METKYNAYIGLNDNTKKKVFPLKVIPLTFFWFFLGGKGRKYLSFILSVGSIYALYFVPINNQDIILFIIIYSCTGNAVFSP